MQNPLRILFSRAGNGNRTHLSTLGRSCSTDELYLHFEQSYCITFEEISQLRFTGIHLYEIHLCCGLISDAEFSWFQSWDECANWNFSLTWDTNPRQRLKPPADRSRAIRKVLRTSRGAARTPRRSWCYGIEILLCSPALSHAFRMIKKRIVDNKIWF